MKTETPELPESGTPRAPYRLILGVLLALLLAIPVLAWWKMEKGDAEALTFRENRNVDEPAEVREHQALLEEVLREIGPIELRGKSETPKLPPLDLPAMPAYPEREKVAEPDE